MKCLKTILQIVLLLNVCFATLSPPSDKKGQKGVKPQEGPRKNNVLDRKLVTETPLVKDILKYHATYHQDVTATKFRATVLGYVTPVRTIRFLFFLLIGIRYRFSYNILTKLIYLITNAFKTHV